jgi:hypothetical protein
MTAARAIQSDGVQPAAAAMVVVFMPRSLPHGSKKDPRSLMSLVPSPQFTQATNRNSISAGVWSSRNRQQRPHSHAASYSYTRADGTAGVCQSGSGGFYEP